MRLARMVCWGAGVQLAGVVGWTAAFVMVAWLARAQATTVTAASYGYDPADATAALQVALDSGADTVVVPTMPAGWVVRPVRQTLDTQVVIFEPGTVLRAKQGEFHGTDDCLYSIVGRTRVTIVGYGARFVMRKADYQNSSLYTPSEHRHALKIESVVSSVARDITVLGLQCDSSGGDGIYIGGVSGYPDCDPVQPVNVLIRDVTCDSNHRQGISVTGAHGLRIENCVLQNTIGTPPQAGIDWEPDWTRLINVSMVNCLMLENLVSGISIYLYRPAWRGPSDVTMSFTHCFSKGANRQGIAGRVEGLFDDGPGGSIVFSDCAFVRTGSYNALLVSDKSALSASLAFNRCWFIKNGSGLPVALESLRNTSDGGPVTTTFGGIAFNDCIVNNDADQACVAFNDAAGNGLGIRGISGRMTINNPRRTSVALGPVTSNITLTVDSNHTSAPIVNITQPAHLSTVSAGSSLSIAVAAHDPDAGSSDGSGIAHVVIIVRRGLTAVDSAVLTTAPFVRSLNTTGWQQGIYSVWAVAVSRDGEAVSSVDAIAVRVSGPAVVATKPSLQGPACLSGSARSPAAGEAFDLRGRAATVAITARTIQCGVLVMAATQDRTTKQRRVMVAR